MAGFGSAYTRSDEGGGIALMVEKEGNATGGFSVEGLGRMGGEEEQGKIEAML